MSVRLSVHLSVHLSIRPSVCLSAGLLIFLYLYSIVLILEMITITITITSVGVQRRNSFVCPTLYLPVSLYLCLSIFLSAHPRRYLAIICVDRIARSVCVRRPPGSNPLSDSIMCLSVRLSVHPSICLSFYLCVCPSVHPSVFPVVRGPFTIFLFVFNIYNTRDLVPRLEQAR